MFIPPDEIRKRRSIASIQKMRVINRGVNWDKARSSDICLISGDAQCLPDDVKRFERWGIRHDLYCTNRSVAFFQRPVHHWAAVDAEESQWFCENVSKSAMPGKWRILRHTIGICPNGYDVFWEIDQPLDNEYQKWVWAGNTGYFAVLSALVMGYKKIILAGMPLDRSPHWYEPEDEEGPNWIGATYTQWMDFKMQAEGAEKIRSMSRYSAFILGEATKDWVNNGI
jgi:hypothetical protein